MSTTAPSRTTMPAEQASALLQRIRGGLIVSCQAPPQDPLHGPEHMTAMARSVARGDVVGIRAEGTDDVRAVRAGVDLPLIGLWKDGAEGVYITPTPRHAQAIAETGAEIVAVDATDRPRPDGGAVVETVSLVHRWGCLFMADVSTLAEGLAAAELGADLISTTLSGYTEHSRQDPNPDLELVADLAARTSVPVVAEGRLHTPEQARAAVEAGAWAVVVGTAITAPRSIAERFARALQ